MTDSTHARLTPRFKVAVTAVIGFMIAFFAVAGLLAFYSDDPPTEIQREFYLLCSHLLTGGFGMLVGLASGRRLSPERLLPTPVESAN